MVKQIKKAAGKIGHFRWWICALLFFAATINYIDRQVIGVLKPTHILTWPGWSELAYGRVISAFQLAYAAMMLVAGALVDRIGIRKGFVLAVVWWSFAAMGHAISGTVLSFTIWRVMLGIGEAANFPASIKAVAEWFPKKDRALAAGIFNAGTNVGAMVTSPMVALILATLHHWQWVFIMTGFLGFFWAALWWFVYKRPEEHPKVSKGELAYIQSGGKEKTEKMPWAPLFKFKQTWAFAIGKGLTDPIWWIWLFWVPGFLYQRFGVDIKSMAGALIIIYLMADVGSVGGGLLPAIFLKRGWSLNAARKTAMLICALLVIPVFYASITADKWVAVLLIGLACGAHQGWSANLFTCASDMFPKRAVGSVVGIGGALGGLGGAFISNIIGWVLNINPNNYMPIFIVASSIYLVSLLIIHLMVPKLEPAKIK